MKKFAFPLADVMKYRDYVRDQAQLDLGRALQAEAVIQSAIDELAERARQAAEAARESGDFRMIQSSHEFHALAAKQTAALMVRLEAAQKASDEKRDAMRTALQQSQAVHKLYDRQLEEYRIAVVREETEVQDDIATTRYKR